MHQDIPQIIRKVGTRILALGVLIFLLAATLLYASSDQLDGLIKGDTREIADVLENGKVGSYVKVETGTVYGTGFGVFENEYDINPEYEYVAIESGDSLLLAKIPFQENGYDGQTFAGVLTDVVPYELWNEFSVEATEYGYNMDEIMLDTTEKGDAFALLFFVGILLLLAIFCAFIGLHRIINPQSHPSLKKLPEGVYAETVLADMERDMEQSGQELAKHIVASSQWLLIKKFLSVRFVNWQDLLWIYKKVTKHKMYGVLTVSKTFTIVFGRQSGKKMELPLSEKHIERVVEHAISVKPEIVVGFSKELDALWRKDHAVFAHLNQAMKADMGE